MNRSLILLLAIAAAFGLEGARAGWGTLAGIAITFVACGWLAATGGVTIATWPGAALLCAPALIGAVQLALGTTADPGATETRMLAWAAAGLLCLIAGSIAHTKRDARDAALDALCYLGGALAVVGLVRAALPEPFAWWPFANRNHFAACCTLLLPVALWRAKPSRKGGWLPFPSAIAGVIALAAATSGSRAGLALAAGQLLCLGAMSQRAALAPRKWLWTAALMLAAAGLLVGGVRWRGPLLQYRDQIWASAAELARQRPHTGHGLGSFAAIYPSVARFDTGEVVTQAHSDWLEWMVEGGWPALAPRLLLLALVLRRLKREPWALGLVAVLLHSLVDYPLQCFTVLSVFAMATGLVLADCGDRTSHRRTRIKPAVQPFQESENFPIGTLQ